MNLPGLPTGPFLPASCISIYSRKEIKEKTPIPLQMLNIIKTLQGKNHSASTLDPKINFTTELLNHLINARKSFNKV